jgi:hypothetical protein
MDKLCIVVGVRLEVGRGSDSKKPDEDGRKSVAVAAQCLSLTN